jgi:hypothetical protein
MVNRCVSPLLCVCCSNAILTMCYDRSSNVWINVWLNVWILGLVSNEKTGEQEWRNGGLEEWREWSTGGRGPEEGKGRVTVPIIEVLR